MPAKPIPKYIHKDGKVYRRFRNAHFTGFIEAGDIPAGDPYAGYTGSKMKWPMLQEIVAWFRSHATDEVTIRLYRRGDDWKAVPWPQEFPSGMSIRELPDHEMVAEAQAEVTDWELAGTIHHHCGATAFQSGTDSSDEKTKPGLHITLGYMNKPVLDIHARVSISVPGELTPEGELVFAAQHAFYGADLSEWIEMPPGCEGVPQAFQAKIIEHQLARLPSGDFPKAWDDRLIKRVYTSTTYGGYGGKDRTYWTPGLPWREDERGKIPPVGATRSTGKSDAGTGGVEQGGFVMGETGAARAAAGGGTTDPATAAAQDEESYAAYLEDFNFAVCGLMEDYELTGEQMVTICRDRRIKDAEEWDIFLCFDQLLEGYRLTAAQAFQYLEENTDTLLITGWSDVDPDKLPAGEMEADKAALTASQS